MMDHGRANIQDNYEDDIQKSIQTWGYTDNFYGFYCMPISYCYANLSFDQCNESEGTAMVFFILESIVNFQNYLKSVVDSIQHVFSLVHAKSSSMVDVFADTSVKQVCSSIT